MTNRGLVLGFVAVVGALAASARAEDVPPGYGTACPSGSTFSSEITNPTDVVRNPTPSSEDQDAFAFPGFPGMVLVATMKPGKGSTILPKLDIVRPGGTVATDEEGLRLTYKGTGLTATMPLDATGWWQIKVRGAEASRHIVTADEAAASTGSDPDHEGDAKVTFSSGTYSISIKYSAPSVTVLPVITKTFKSSATIDSKTDTDDYRFQGYPGQTVASVLKATVVKGVAPLIPGLALFKPDGTQVTTAVITTKGSTVTLGKFVMDQQGTWRLHVVGLEPVQPDPDPATNTSTTGAYTISVTLGKVSPAPSLQPDANHQYRFTLPATGGATIGYTLKYTGAPPVFNSFLDPTGAQVIGIGTKTTLPAFTLPATKPLGNYTLTFDAPATAPTGVSFVPKLVLPKSLKPRKVTMSKVEPLFVVTPTDPGVHPSAGGPSTVVAVNANERVLDSSDPDPNKVKIYLGHIPLLSAGYDTGTKKIHGTVPANVPLGTYDLVIESSTGQITVQVGAFESVESPHSLLVDPVVGTSEGFFPITITGSGFRPGHVGIKIDGSLVPAQVLDVTDTTVTFTAPRWNATTVTFGVVDTETQLVGNLPLNSFEFVGTAAMSRIVPSITTVLGGDLITIKGANFAATDHVYLETAPLSGVYQEFFNTFVDDQTRTRHQFTAPVRGKGVHRVKVTDQFGQPNPARTRDLTYFQFSNLTSDPTVFPTGADEWDGVTTAVGDFDKDGDDDLFVSRVGGGSLGTSTLTRVLRNDGTGHFTDVTSGATGVMPAVATGEDWRADRIWASDINLDGYADIVIVSNDNSVLSANKSHVRILINEPRTGTSTTDRVFRDRTLTMFPTVRLSSQLYGGGGETVVDSWRGLDMWVGDIDKGPAGPPEILIVNKDLKEELDVGCGAYCASPYSSGYTYGFYWGGSRAFTWNPAANAGNGKYKFDHNFFPRKAGVRVPVIAPGGVKIPICNSSYGSPCRGKFTPFVGKRISVGDLNADGKPDIAVISDDPVTKDGTTISSLQVAINKFSTSQGSAITDVTDTIGIIGGNFQGDTVEIGQPGFPDGNSFGTIAMTKASGLSSAFALRLLKFKTPSLPNAQAEFEEITTLAMPAASANDRWQASRIIFRDVDTDGDQDMILVCDAAPGGVDPAFRVLRNERVGIEVGVFRETFKGLITPLMKATEHFEGSALTIGDVNKDGALDFIITRATTSPTSTAPQTRILITDKSNP